MMGFLMTPVTSEHGWSREIFAFAIAIQNLVWGLGQPFVGMFPGGGSGPAGGGLHLNHKTPDEGHGAVQAIDPLTGQMLAPHASREVPEDTAWYLDHFSGGDLVGYLVGQ